MSVVAVVAWPSGQKAHFFRGGSPGAGSNLGVAGSIFFFFHRFFRFLPFDFLLFILTADPVSFARFLRKLISSKTINWSANSFQMNHVTSMSWHMSPRYGHVKLFSGHPVSTTVIWPYCECDLSRPIYRSFDSLPCNPTRAICRRVRAYVCSVNHVTTKGKEVDYILWVWDSSF